MDKVRKITALLTVVLIVVLVIATFVCAVTGSKYFFGMLALTFLVPIVLWVFMWFTKLVNNKSNITIEEGQNDNESE